MRCTRPRTVGFWPDGKTLCWSQKDYSKEYPTFQIPCGKCISCRLESARQTAVRCVHEASMYERNSFVTLTYSNEHLVADKLYYVHFQKFIKNLRTRLFQDLLNSVYPNLDQKMQRKLWREKTKENREELYEKIRISVFCTGEYGDRKKRPHWHALIFNWRPSDCTHKYTNDRGDKVYSSETLDEIWGQGICELGDVTFESAGYCARYASKKLIHGPDGSHEYNPISRRSSKQAIGKKWIEKNWRDVFNYGELRFEAKPGEIITCGIPRYYEKWLKKNRPADWIRYVTQVKPKKIEEAEKKEAKITREEKLADQKRSGLKGLAVKQRYAREKILQKKFEQLQKYQKDI